MVISVQHMEVNMQLLTVEQVADALQVEPVTVRRMLKRGDLRGLKLSGKEWRIRPEDLEAYIQSKLTDIPAQERQQRMDLDDK